eukprot:TRINITY_DN14808_c0_g1_i11.p1 TRINITY_DN14808_c0_g1~~TRINITY_DN14808_c0_g1_i11.p1  ORF type:complete len:504 (-),score=55.78 TRINITY_DN14808_c0_g1_i11:477-1988(-)
MGENKQDTDEGATKLKRNLGLFDGVSIIVGIIVGSGIFVSPKGVLLYSGSIGIALVVWVLSGLLSLIGALCYAELGTMIPQSGGDYAYILTTFGSLPAFLYLWSALIIIMPAGNAITALTFANYVLEPFYPECDPPDPAVRLLAALVICLLTAVNCHNVKWTTRIQDAFSIMKVLALVVIILAGFIYLGSGHFHNLEAPFQDSKTNPGQIVLAFYSGLFSFAGWNYLNFVTEELNEPEKNLPRAIYLSLPLVTIIYLLANFAYFTVLSPTELLASNAVAVSFGGRLLGSMSWIMPLFVACSTFGAVNGGIFASSRLFFVGARNGHMPKLMAFLNITQLTPVPCLIILGLITLSMLTTSNVFVLINYASFVESTFITLSVGALLYLRYKEPERNRPIKVNLVLPILFFLLCSILVCVPIFTQPWDVGFGLVIVASGIPVYFLFCRFKKPAWLQNIFWSLECTVQKLCIALEEETEEEKEATVGQSKNASDEKGDAPELERLHQD